MKGMVANGTDLLESPSETEKAKVPALSSNETSPASLARDEWYSAVVQEVHPFGAKLEVTPETGEAVLGWVPICEVSDRLERRFLM